LRANFNVFKDSILKSIGINIFFSMPLAFDELHYNYIVALLEPNKIKIRIRLELWTKHN
jgi:hypothetical protein